MFGWFRKKPETPPAPRDCRVWNEDWKVGDTAECVVDNWHSDLPHWERPRIGQQFRVLGFKDSHAIYSGKRAYFLILEGWPVALETTAFRKVRPVATEESEVVSRILNAKPGADRTREGVGG